MAMYEQVDLFEHEMLALCGRKAKAKAGRARKIIPPVPDAPYLEQCATGQRVRIPPGVVVDAFGRQRCSRVEFRLGEDVR